MSIQYKIDIVSALKSAGYSTYRIRKERLFSESTLTAFRTNKLVSYDNIERVCRLLQCDIGDVLCYVADVGGSFGFSPTTPEEKD